LDTPSLSPFRRTLWDARSWLFVPGDRAPEFLPKAAAVNPDALILDLEDGVSGTHKDAAREQVGQALAVLPRHLPLVVRINGLNTKWWREDVAVAVAGSAEAIVPPKVSDTADIDALSRAIGSVDESARPNPLPIVALVESARGVLNSVALAAHPQVRALALGGEDLATDLGVRRSPSGIELDHARGRIVLACAAAGCSAIDTPTMDTSRLEVVSAEAVAAHAIGFTGKLAIHPRQVASVNSAFGPSGDDLRWARSVITAIDQAAEHGRAVAVVDGRVVDEPVVRTARRMLARGSLDGDHVE
jgi:citrate lyase subunit beta / citryl-CoA lyase